MQRQTSHCLKCKNRIPAGRRLCNSCRKPNSPAPSRTACVPMWTRILAVRDAGTFSTNPRKLITTADMLALKNKSLLSASGAEFEMAADLADRWNAFLTVTA